jgi:hypothetical protein
LDSTGNVRRDDVRSWSDEKFYANRKVAEALVDDKKLKELYQVCWNFRIADRLRACSTSTHRCLTILTSIAAASLGLIMIPKNIIIMLLAVFVAVGTF